MTAEEKVEAIQAILDAGHSDAFSMHEIRKLFPRIEPNPIQFGGAVIPLPDNGDWTDTGSGAGYDPRD